MGNLLIHLVFVIDASLWTPEEISLAYSRVVSAVEFWQSQGVDVRIEPALLWETRFIPQAEQARFSTGALSDLLSLSGVTRHGTLFVMRDSFWMNPYGFARCNGDGAVLSVPALSRIAAHEIGHLLCLNHADSGVMKDGTFSLDPQTKTELGFEPQAVVRLENVWHLSPE